MGLKPFPAVIKADGAGSETQIASNYSYTISARGIPLGTLKTFAPSNTRTLERLREIRANASQGIVDVLKIAAGREEPTFRATRVEIYKNALLQAFGFGAISDLNEINELVDVHETMTDSAGNTSTIVYKGCLPTDWRKTVDIGTIFVAEESTFAVTEIIGSV